MNHHNEAVTVGTLNQVLVEFSVLFFHVIGGKGINAFGARKCEGYTLRITWKSIRHHINGVACRKA